MVNSDYFKVRRADNYDDISDLIRYTGKIKWYNRKTIIVLLDFSDFLQHNSIKSPVCYFSRYEGIILKWANYTYGLNITVMIENDIMILRHIHFANVLKTYMIDINEFVISNEVGIFLTNIPNLLDEKNYV